MLWEQIITKGIDAAEFTTVFFKVFNEEQLLDFLLKLNSYNEEDIIKKDVEEGYVIYDLGSITPDPTIWGYEELCMIYLFERYEVILRTNQKEGIAEFSS